MTLITDLGTALAPAVPVTLAYVCAEWVKWNKKRRTLAKKAAPPLDDLTVADNTIVDLLERVGRDLSAQRVYYSRIHNGDTYDPEDPDKPGASIWRKTRTHEWVRAGVAYQSEEFRGMVISSIPEEMELVRVDGPAWTRVADVRPSKFRWLMERGGVKSVARCAVHKTPRRIVGFVGADWDVDMDCAPAGVVRLCECAAVIAQILMR